MLQCFVFPAAQLLESIDLNADPCHDFFQYACGSWNKKHIIPEDKSSYNMFEQLHDNLQVKLKSKYDLCANDVFFLVLIKSHSCKIGHTVEPLWNDHPHQRPSILPDFCDGCQVFSIGAV